MANGRFVSRSISSNEELAGVSIEAALLFSWSIPQLDVDGRLPGSPMWLKTNVVPLRDELTLKSIPRCLEELGAAIDRDGTSLIVWYETRLKQVLFFPGFGRQQSGLRRDREGKSRLPGLPEATRIIVGVPPGSAPGETPGATPGEAPASAPEKRLQEEGEGEVQEKFKPPPSTRAREARPRTAAEERLAARLASDADRNALTALVVRVPHVESWLSEMEQSLNGMAGHHAVTPEQLGQAIRDYVANGVATPGLKHFRSYLRRAAIPEPEIVAGSGRRPAHDASFLDVLKHG